MAIGVDAMCTSRTISTASLMFSIPAPALHRLCLAGGLISPTGLAFGPDGNLYVASSGFGGNSFISRYNGNTVRSSIICLRSALARRSAVRPRGYRFRFGRAAFMRTTVLRYLQIHFSRCYSSLCRLVILPVPCLVVRDGFRSERPLRRGRDHQHGPPI